METAYVLVKSKIAHEMEVLNEILKLDGVKEVKGTFGVYDIFVKVEADSQNQIQDIITKKIGRKTVLEAYNKKRPAKSRP